MAVSLAGGAAIPGVNLLTRKERSMARSVKNPSGYVAKGSSANEKALQFGTHIREFGWAGKFDVDDDNLVHLTAHRDENETIDVWWEQDGRGKLCLEKLPVYSIGGDKTQCRNVSHAVQICESEADTTRLKRASSRARKAGTTDIVAPKTDRFADMADDEIEKLLLGKSVAWINSLSGGVDTADVLGRKTIRVVRNGRDYVEFTDKSGFHAVYLDAIVSVK